MKTSAKRTRLDATAGNGDNLAAWLTDPRTSVYFGNSWKLKASVLAAVISGRPLAAVALEHRVTAEAAYKYARRARAIFPTLHNEKLTRRQV